MVNIINCLDHLLEVIVVVVVKGGYQIAGKYGNVVFLVGLQELSM